MITVIAFLSLLLCIAIIILPIILLKLLIAKMMANVAASKGYGKEAHAFAMCFWLGVCGYIYVTALPDKILQEQNRRMLELLENSHKATEKF